MDIPGSLWMHFSTLELLRRHFHGSNHFSFIFLQLKKSFKGLAFWSPPMYHQSAKLRKVQDLESVIAAQICATVAIIRWRPPWALESSFQCWPTYLSFKKVTKSTVLPTLTTNWKRSWDHWKSKPSMCSNILIHLRW